MSALTCRQAFTIGLILGRICVSGGNFLYCKMATVRIGISQYGHVVEIAKIPNSHHNKM